jgi:predicted N-formylglutamate amidohydrolase
LNGGETMTRFSPIVTAEHASNAVPDALETLGLSDETLASHVAWDPGVAPVAAALAAALEAPLFVGEYSRLVADLNRSPGSAEVVPEVAFGVIVPGNLGLDAAARNAREARYHRPYWTKVGAALSNLRPPILHLSIHSFTESLHGKRRDVDLGILIDPDRPLEAEVSGLLRPKLHAFGFDVRENEPYDGRGDGLTTRLRSARAPLDYAGVEIEISQRLLPELPRVTESLIDAVRALV